MKHDTEGVHFHNSLWASALSGVSGTAMFWWWDQLDKQDAYSHYRPLAAFLTDVTLTGFDHFHSMSSNNQYRWLGYQGKNRAYLWIANRQVTWWNQVTGKKQPTVIEGAKIAIRGFQPGNYHLEWWDTYEGKIIQTETVSCVGDLFQISVPSFSRDIACKIQKTENR
jgi:hypothetical protein